MDIPWGNSYKIGKSVWSKYNCALFTENVHIFLEFFALLTFCEYQLVLLATSSDVWIIVVPFLMVISYSVIIGLKNSFSCGWLPALVVLPCTVSSAFAKGFRAVSRRYFRVLSTTFCMAFLWCCVFYLFGIMSLFAILPISSMLLLIFDFVMFFSSQGMSFYVDYNTVLTPKKLEQTDKLRKAKEEMQDYLITK